MRTSISLLAVLALLTSASANPIIHASTSRSLSPSEATGIMSLFATPTPPPAPIPLPSSTPAGPSKDLSVCCCCLSEPQPEAQRYMSECPREGVRAVCGDAPPDEGTGYTLGGLEGQPDEIARVCSTTADDRVLMSSGMRRCSSSEPRASRYKVVIGNTDSEAENLTLKRDA
ncbi:hypothetical protein AAE478_004075 [Parahypoxylon ruwenzoriense]